MERVITIDQTLFRWINGHHNDLMDWTMWTFSQGWSWAILLLVVIAFTTFKHDRKSWLWVLVGIGLCFLLADQISNNAIKEGVQRLRPCYELEGVRMFHTGKGGHYGFVSSHAANSFAVAMFISLMYGGKRRTENQEPETKISGYKNSAIPYVMFTWAALVCYSRAYLGKHYPGDLICGALLGLGIGAMVYFVISSIRRKTASKSLA